MYKLRHITYPKILKLLKDVRAVQCTYSFIIIMKALLTCFNDEPYTEKVKCVLLHIIKVFLSFNKYFVFSPNIL